MSKKLIVFRCEGCIEDLKEYNPYVHDGKDVAINEIFLVKTSLEECENTCCNMDINNYASIVIKPVMRGYYENDGFDLLVNLAVEQALSNGFKVHLKVWATEYCRDQGFADYYTITNVERINDLFCGVCQEIAINDGEEEYIIAHYEDDSDDCYILDDILMFIKEATL